MRWLDSGQKLFPNESPSVDLHGYFCPERSDIDFELQLRRHRKQTARVGGEMGTSESVTDPKRKNEKPNAKSPRMLIKSTRSSTQISCLPVRPFLSLGPEKPKRLRHDDRDAWRSDALPPGNSPQPGGRTRGRVVAGAVQ